MPDFIITDNKLEKYNGTDTEVKIPDNVKTIEINAFSCSENLQSVIIPEGVEVIGFAAFRECKNLQSVTIPKSVTTIMEFAFENCSKLKNLSIPESTQIQDSAFFGCRALADKNKMIIFHNTLFEYFGRKTSVEIPDGVTAIADQTFEDCNSLQNIVIPEGVKVIGYAAFHKCKNLQSIVIPESVKEIGLGAFKGCKNLKSISIPDSITEIYSSTFYECENLQTVEIGNGIQTISDYAFPEDLNVQKWVLAPDSQNEEQCKMLLNTFGTKNLALPFLSGTMETNETLRKMLQTRVTNKKFREKFIPMLIEQNESKAFASLLSLTKKMPVEEIDSYIKKSENALEIRLLLLEYKKRLYPAEILEKMEEIQMEKEFGLREKTLADYKKDFKIVKHGDFYKITGYKSENESMSIPSAIEGIPVRIAKKAFACCNVSYVYIENGITDIEERAFSGCDNLKEITIPESISMIGLDAFFWCENLHTIYYDGSISHWNHIFIVDPGVSVQQNVATVVCSDGETDFWFD